MSRNNIQDVDFSTKCGCMMYTIIVHWQAANHFVCSICQKLANCTSISNSRVKTSKLRPNKYIFSLAAKIH